MSIFCSCSTPSREAHVTVDVTNENPLSQPTKVEGMWNGNRRLGHLVGLAPSVLTRGLNW